MIKYNQSLRQATLFWLRASELPDRLGANPDLPIQSWVVVPKSLPIGLKPAFGGLIWISWGSPKFPRPVLVDSLMGPQLTSLWVHTQRLTLEPHMCSLLRLNPSPTCILKYLAHFKNVFYPGFFKSHKIYMKNHYYKHLRKMQCSKF